jgi:MerR family transcriptional regulator, light-induced transcriptional regulator
MLGMDSSGESAGKADKGQAGAGKAGAARANRSARASTAAAHADQTSYANAAGRCGAAAPSDDNMPGSANGRPAFVPATAPTPLALARMVEGEIIPRLLLAHRSHDAATDAQQQRIGVPAIVLEPGTVRDFAAQALRHETYVLLGLAEAQMARGMGVEALFVELLAPAARQLGIWWEDDECDFVDVTMGLWRLQEVVHEISARVPGTTEGDGGERRAFFAVPPGDQHSFGLLMVEEVFRRAGWSTWSAPAASRRELVQQVGSQWFEIIGLTVTLDADVDDLPELIAELRAASRNSRAAIMVGGRVFLEDATLAARVGADVAVADPRLAVASAEALVLAQDRRAVRSGVRG